MVIGKIGAENNQKLGADEVRQRAGRRIDAQCRFEPGNIWLRDKAENRDLRCWCRAPAFLKT